MTNDNFITVRRPAGTDTIGAGGLPTNEDDYGNLTVSSFDTIATFWADVEELAPNSDDFGVPGTIRFNRRLRLTTDTRDVASVDLDDILTIDEDTQEWAVTSIDQSRWKWMSEITVEYANR